MAHLQTLEYFYIIIKLRQTYYNLTNYAAKPPYN